MTYVSKKAPPPFLIGIDPDCSQSGWAEANTQSRVITLDNLFAPILQQKALTYDSAQTLFVVEAGWRNPAIWHGKNTAGWDPNKAKAYGAAIGKHVGANHAVGLSIISFLTANGYEVAEYVPRSGKWNHARFLQILAASRYTCPAKRTNPEQRDAARCLASYIF